MPSKMGKLLDMLGVDPQSRMLSDVRVGDDRNYGQPSNMGGLKDNLFPALPA